jgi:hypothetical protein
LEDFLANENITNSSVDSAASDSLRDADASDKALSGVSYAPPTLIRALRITVPTIAGLLAIGLFTFAYYQSYEQNNQSAFDNYVAEFYAQQEANNAPQPTVEELLQETFNPPATLSAEALADLRSFQYVVSSQLALVENLEITREGDVVFFRHDRKEYTLNLTSAESYKFIDDYIAKSTGE